MSELTVHKITAFRWAPPISGLLVDVLSGIWFIKNKQNSRRWVHFAIHKQFRALFIISWSQNIILLLLQSRDAGATLVLKLCPSCVPSFPLQLCHNYPGFFHYITWFCWYRYRVQYSYQPRNDDELELRAGDVVYVVEMCDDGWFVGTCERTQDFGTFPGNYVQKMR